MDKTLKEKLRILYIEWAGLGFDADIKWTGLFSDLLYFAKEWERDFESLDSKLVLTDRETVFLAVIIFNTWSKDKHISHGS